MKEFLILLAILFGSTVAQAAEPSVYIITPLNGAMVTNPVTITFGLKGMGIAPAGVENPHTGHHHLIIDAALPDLSKPIPKDEHYLHFGNGQTEAQIELSPGTHTLQLLLGDFMHKAHKPPIFSEKITVTVQ